MQKAVHSKRAPEASERPGGLWAGRFQRTLGLELALGAALLLGAATQLNTAPSKAAWEAQRQIGQRLEAENAPEPLVLWVAPGRVGDNVLALDLDAGRANDATTPQVLFRFTMPGHEMAPLEAAADPVGDGRFTTRGGFLSMAGRWQVETIVRRAGQNDVTHTFLVDVRSR